MNWSPSPFDRLWTGSSRSYKANDHESGFIILYHRPLILPIAVKALYSSSGAFREKQHQHHEQ